MSESQSAGQQPDAALPPSAEQQVAQGGVISEVPQAGEPAVVDLTNNRGMDTMQGGYTGTQLGSMKSRADKLRLQGHTEEAAQLEAQIAQAARRLNDDNLAQV